MKVVIECNDLRFIYIYEGAVGEFGDTLNEEQLRSFRDKHCLFVRYTHGNKKGEILCTDDVVGMESMDESALIRVCVYKYPTNGGLESERGEYAALEHAKENYPTFLANQRTCGSAQILKGHSEFGIVVIEPVGLKSEGSVRLAFNGSLDSSRLDRAREHMKKFGMEDLYVEKPLASRPAAPDAGKSKKKKKAGARKVAAMKVDIESDGDSSDVLGEYDNDRNEDEFSDDESLDDGTDAEAAEQAVFDDTAHYVASWDARAYSRSKGAYKLSKMEGEVGDGKCSVVDVDGGKQRTIDKSSVFELLGHEAMAKLKPGEEVYALDKDQYTFYKARVVHSLVGLPQVVSIDDDDDEVSREVSLVFVAHKNEE